MNDIAIRVKGVSKSYKYSQMYTNGSLGGVAHSILSRILYNKQLPENKIPVHKDSTFWALKDITFDIEKGSAVGIIGKNGSGKSTLLKVLSRITVPTEGKAWIKGNVSALLEVGSGFKLDLTGRENIYLNGAFLGISHKQIDEYFNQIVSFAGVEEFIDVPVKFYSSGMYMRLAFSVANFVYSDVLLVDEVLAVGDAEFQKQCIADLEKKMKMGTTVLFVSHSLELVQKLCQKVIVLDAGRIVANGTPEEIIPLYANQMLPSGHDIS